MSRDVYFDNVQVSNSCAQFFFSISGLVWPSANLHFSSQVSCVFLCFRVSVFPETQKHGNMENMLQLH